MDSQTAAPLAFMVSGEALTTRRRSWGMPREGMPMDAQNDSVQKSLNETSPDITTHWFVLNFTALPQGPSDGCHCWGQALRRMAAGSEVPRLC